MSMRVWGLMSLLLFLTACATERLVPVPEVVEVPGPIRYVEIPAQLTERCQKVEIPEQATYAEAIELWAEDRSSIDACNGKLAGIESLGVSE